MLGGCGQLIASQTAGLARELSDAMLNHDDPQTVAAAIPTFLVTMDAMAGDDASADMRFSAARLYSAYSGSFVDEGFVAGMRMSDITTSISGCARSRRMPSAPEVAVSTR